jgi:two-component system sensor histidine kinase VicK
LPQHQEQDQPPSMPSHPTSSTFSIGNNDIEKTEVLYGEEFVIEQTLNHFAKTRHQIDALMPSQGVIVLVETKRVWNSLQQLLKSKRVKGRAIITITKENIAHCKELTRITEVRHLDNIQGSFSIADKKEYHGTALVQRSKPVLQIINSTVNSFVELQQYFFDTLWNQSIPASQKMMEIEEGITPEFIQTITDSKEIKEIQKNLIESAKEEILILFPNSRTFNHQRNQGLIKLLYKISISNPALKTRIIVPDDQQTGNTGEGIIKDTGSRNFGVQYLAQQTGSTVLILVVDKRYSLYIEVKDTRNNPNNNPIYNSDSDCGNDKDFNVTNNNINVKTSHDDGTFGLGTFSNSKATVIGYASIFESLWNQSILFRELVESKAQLHSAINELDSIKQYINDVLKEVKDTPGNN